MRLNQFKHFLQSVFTFGIVLVLVSTTGCLPKPKKGEKRVSMSNRSSLLVPEDWIVHWVLDDGLWISSEKQLSTEMNVDNMISLGIGNPEAFFICTMDEKASNPISDDSFASYIEDDIKILTEGRVVYNLRQTEISHHSGKAQRVTLELTQSNVTLYCDRYFLNTGHEIWSLNGFIYIDDPTEYYSVFERAFDSLRP